MPLVIAGLLSLLVWLYLLAARGGFWRVRSMLPSSSAVSVGDCAVAVVVPARNEADVISQSITSLLSQTYSGSIHVFLVDDSSTDDTSGVAREAALKAGRSECLTVIEGLPLPQGWSGKLWAVQQGVERAGERSPKFFLLTDADIVHSPENIGSLVAQAEAGRYDLTSFMVRLHCGTSAERFLVPAFVFFFFMLYPPAWVRNRSRKIAGSAGGCILIRPEALKRAGGIAAIRGEIIDDCALAGAVKSTGSSVWLGLTESAASVRPYKTYAEVGRMISRTAFNQLRHSATLLLFSLVGLTITYLLPPLLLFTHRPLPVALGAVAWLLMTLAFLPMVRFYGLNPLRALTLPLTAVFYMGATLHSALRYWSGKGGVWKGRVQDPSGGISD